MAKVLVLQFLNTEGKTVKVNLDSPKEPIDQVAIHSAIEKILAANIFITTGGEFVSQKDAVIDRNVSEINL